MAEVTGYAAIDNCVGGGCVLYCGVHCDPNGQYCAWPNYPSCQADCSVIPSEPRAAGCNGIVWFGSPCQSNQYGASIFDCGPDPNQPQVAGWCNPGGFSFSIVACITTSLFVTLCNGCNPMIGLVVVYAQVL